jgi:ribosomal protein S12 methylthiotransferase
MKEAELMAEKGVKELILVSQDTSYYGRDLYRKSMILELLENLAKENIFEWIRPLYWYPTLFPMAYVELMDKYPAIIPYLDMPVQHASDRILHLMRRGETNGGLRELYKRIKSVRPDIILRTTFIVGHPGETDDDFKILMDFIEEIQYDRLGAFIYSDEDGTAAYQLPQKIGRHIAHQRYAELLEKQRQISFTKNKHLVGSIQKVLVDEYDQDQKVYYGRTYRDAPEIDNDVIIKSKEFRPGLVGSFIQTKITNAFEYELYGSLDVYDIENI